MSKKHKKQKKQHTQKNLAVAIALINSLNNAAPLAMAAAPAADAMLNAPLKEQLGRGLAAGFNRGGQLMNRLFFTTAYAEEIGSNNSPKDVNADQTADGDTINSGGIQNVNSGGSATNTWIHGGEQNISSGGSASVTWISDGEQNISNGGSACNTSIWSGGTQHINSGGSASNTSIWGGGTQHINSGGSASVTEISSGGSQNISGGSASNTSIWGGGTQHISSGGIASVTEISSGGSQNISGGSASNTSIWGGGTQHISSGGIASDTYVNGGSQNISSGGSATSTRIYDGGSQNISSGGIASVTRIYGGGSQNISSGGIASVTRIFSGGSQNISSGGSASVTIINVGGSQNISSGGSATDTTINSGGSQNINDGGIASDTTINGGIQNISSGGIASGTTINSGEQHISSGGSATNTSISAGGVQHIRSGGNASITTIDGGAQYVDGSASGTTINSGEQQVNSGGNATNTSISAGGVQHISSGGNASSTTIDGGAQVVSSGGSATNTSISLGGMQNVNGSADGTIIDGGVQIVNYNGSATSTTINGGGWQNVSGSASGTTINSGGTQYIYSGGNASDTTINSGGYLGMETGASLLEQTKLNQGTIQLFGGSGDSFSIDKLEITGGGCVNLTGNSADDIINGNASDKEVGRSLTIKTLTGSADFIINTDLEEGLADEINIDSGTAEHTLQIAYDPIFENGGSANDVAVHFATVEDGTTFAAASTDYGAYRYIPTLEADADGWSITGLNLAGGSETMYTATDAAAGSLLLWRRENNSLIRRMGELRHGTSKNGDWARIYKGEQEANLADRRITQQYTAIQGGHDKAFNWGGQNWRAGYTVGYLDANASYNRGSGDASSFSIGGYATWLGDKGHYLDFIIKQGRLKNSYDSYLDNPDGTKVSGSYHNWGTSLSAEYGYRTSLKDGWYVEPQSEFTLGRVTSADYTASDGTSVRHNGITSVVGRLGVSIGRTVGENSFYATTTWAREFNASPRVSMSSGGMSEVTLEHNLQGSWLEMSLGVTGQLGGNQSGYLEISRTTGGKVKTPWQANVGVSWNF